MIPVLLTMAVSLASAGKSWAHKQDHHAYNNFIDEGGTPKSHINRLDVVCSKDHMTVNMQFNTPFYGMVFSHASPQHERCVHVGPRAGVRDISFHISYDGCGTKEDLTGQFHENTIVIQYGEDILEAWDEAKKLRCEWLESFEKKSSKPVLAISDIDTVELNFQGDDIDCWMEVQEGKGPWSRQVGGIVPIGSPLTLVIAINDNTGEFDMRVKKCSASDGSGHEVQLTDNDGCVLRQSLLTPFAKIRDFGGKATLVAYSHIFAFKFPNTLDVFVHCMVEVCRHGCLDPCGGQIPTHPNHRSHLISLESKKQQKLVEFANSKEFIQPPVRSQVKPILKPPVQPPFNTVLQSPVNLQLKTAVQDIPKNNPLKIDDNGVLRRQKPNYLTQIPAHILQKIKSEKSQNNEVPKPKGQLLYESLVRNISTASAFFDKHLTKTEHGFGPSILHNSPFNAANNVKSKTEILSSATNIHSGPNGNTNSENLLNTGPRVVSDVKSIPIGHYHRIIGHDAHWNSEEVKVQDEQYLKHHIPPLTGISYQSPQLEPATWSGDQVTKQEVFQPHVEVETVRVQYPGPGNIPGTYTVKEVLRQNLVPQPEPAAWTADDVKPLSKQEVLHPHLSKHQINPPIQNFPKIHPQEPKPEPAPWTFDDVNPLHRPNVQHQPYLKNPHVEEEPKPEPGSWTLQDVKPLTKEDFKVHSLNYKQKSHPHVADHHLPVYKENVVPFTIAPEPVYIPQPTLNPKNMSGMMMMNMMMMMPTLLPYTYQTARWPPKSTARLVRPDKQNFPYPVPQFPHRHVNLGVVADRRMDSEESDLQYELDAKSHISSDSKEHINVDPSKNDTVSIPLRQSEQEVKSHVISAKVKPVDSEQNEGALEKQSHDSHRSQVKETTASGVRPPVVGFVAPSLDVDEFNFRPEDKDRSAHSPRALNHRRKRSSEPVFGVKQRFQAIALSDLAFEMNMTNDGMAIFKGRPEEIIYGICMSPASMSFGIGFILILTLCSLMASLVLYEHSYRLRNKKSHLSVLSRTFNGRLESLYRVSRRHPNSSVS
ncbi:hypothetical protein JTE90_005831 [Oedothorax gibbosus]|uniref:ZP domain-containing protein n=1 Tax=Oedothorax gibbosus TaxID=931172 RepID=A0AAV6V255_9ARAC|nr:hypothetical protein JTE90_005831 [Oedothorax gibbosus]